MAHNELNLSFSEDSTRQSNACIRCGDTAEIRLTLLGDMPHRSGNFCFACSEFVIHDLQKQQTAHQLAETGVLAGFAESGTTHKALPHSHTPHDEVEGGIIYWEGHGWSSDGPFAGA